LGHEAIGRIFLAIISETAIKGRVRTPLHGSSPSVYPVAES
jgi:hypothetical protein